MPLPLKLESAPPETLTSAVVKFVDVSLNMKVIVAVSPTPNVDLFVE